MRKRIKLTTLLKRTVLVLLLILQIFLPANTSLCQLIMCLKIFIQPFVAAMLAITSSEQIAPKTTPKRIVETGESVVKNHDVTSTNCITVPPITEPIAAAPKPIVVP
mgnify:CR=1 FL=1